jgi:SAM-dependent methyltransferase
MFSEITKPLEFPQSVQMVDGIAIRLQLSDVEQELSRYRKELRTVELAKTAGWRHALESECDPAMVAYSANQKRWKFLDVVPLSKNVTALEIGIGLGQHTGEIASRVAHLDTLEVRLVNAMFAKTRCEQERVYNVTFTCGGDDCRLPFPDGQYDVVLLNLVFEWCASELNNESAERAQRRLLTEIYRVLKPCGMVQLNTKNRFSYRLLTGGPDEHSYEVPFGSALPRWLLRLILWGKGKSRPAGYLHSWWALKRLLRDAGFIEIVSYWAVPEMRFPEYLIPVNARAIRAARKSMARQGESRRTDLMMRLTPANLVKFFAPGLFFIARK